MNIGNIIAAIVYCYNGKKRLANYEITNAAISVAEIVIMVRPDLSELRNNYNAEISVAAIYQKMLGCTFRCLWIFKARLGPLDPGGKAAKTGWQQSSVKYIRYEHQNNFTTSNVVKYFIFKS